MMKQMKMMLPVIFMMIIVASGCSVKENRDLCPCALTLDFRDLDTAMIESVDVMATSSGSIIFYDRVNSSDFDREYVRDVPHGSLHVMVWDGWNEVDMPLSALHIPYGSECPPVYMHSFVADTRGETCCEKVSLRKNHCMLTVKMSGREDVPYSLGFKGSVDGYSMDGIPSEGKFYCLAYPVGTGGLQVKLPRQKDSSLLLEVDDGAPHSKVFAIGEYLKAGGYDWTSKDLEDVTVTLDYYMTSITIHAAGWEKEEVYNVIL